MLVRFTNTNFKILLKIIEFSIIITVVDFFFFLNVLSMLDIIAAYSLL